MPFVPVIFPVNNGKSSLRKAINSIMAQTFNDLELIVIEDGSTDSTSDILKEYAARDVQVLVKRQSLNTGIVTALNNGCQLARRKYIPPMIFSIFL